MEISTPCILMTLIGTGAAPELLYWWSLASVIGWGK